MNSLSTISGRPILNSGKFDYASVRPLGELSNGIVEKSMTKELRLQFHHVGYAVRDIAPAVESYVSRFGYEPVTAAIHDSAQTATVQFLRLPGDQAYLEFVSPDGPGSKLADAVKRRGALNHLCYTAGRLEEAIEHLEQEGMRLISELSPGVAFRGRRICWLLGDDMVPIELVERRLDDDPCTPGI